MSDWKIPSTKLETLSSRKSPHSLTEYPFRIVSVKNFAECMWIEVDSSLSVSFNAILCSYGLNISFLLKGRGWTRRQLFCRYASNIWHNILWDRLPMQKTVQLSPNVDTGPTDSKTLKSANLGRGVAEMKFLSISLVTVPFFRTSKLSKWFV